jgi:hypothetical protein
MSLMEVIIGLVLVSVLIITFGVSLVAAVYAQKVQTRNMASALADLQLAVLQTYSSSTLATQSYGTLIGVLFSQGTWKTVSDATAPSASNTFETKPSGSVGLTSVMPLPANAYDNFSLTAKVKVVTGSPVGWKAGLMFRAQDPNNYYMAYLTTGNLYVKKIVNGVETTLYSDLRSIAADTWQTLNVVTNGSSMDVYLNGSLATTQSDASFSVGKAALAGWEGPTLRFDDVTIGGYTWGFDSTVIDKVHDDWLRFGLSNLPTGTGSLTIAQPYSDASVKKYTATINWDDKGITKTVQHSSQVIN